MFQIFLKIIFCNVTFNFFAILPYLFNSFWLRRFGSAPYDKEVIVTGIQTQTFFFIFYGLVRFPLK